jgi:RNA polymerase sigma factor (TIGR02999 family)
MSDATRLLDAIARGDPRAAGALLPVVYDELRRLAAVRLAREAPGQTLSPTALVHEAYVRLVGSDPQKPWDGRGHFFAAAAEAMRRILVENARRKRAGKHGGGRARAAVDPDRLPCPDPTADPDDLLALDEALDRLAAVDPKAAELVQLRYFAGLSVKQAAEALGVAPRTADFLWSYARAWLLAELRDS